MVGPTSVARIDLTPADTLIAVGSQALCRAVARAANGDVLANRPLTFISVNGAVATVTATGAATGVAPGQTVLTVRSAEGRGGAIISATALLRVEAAAVIAEPSALSFDTEVGQPLPPAQTINLRNGGGGTLGSLTIVGTVPELSATLNGATLTVRPVSAQTPGTVLTFTLRVHSSTPGVVDAVIPVTVRGPAAVATVALSPNGANLVVGGTAQLTAVLKDAGGNTLTGRTVGWTSSNLSVATVNTNGLVTAVGAGTSTVTATSETRSAVVTVTVTPVPIAVVSVSLASTSLTVGGTTQATAATRDGNNNILTGRAVAWLSSNTSVATVNAVNDLVTAVSAGVSNIMATSEGKTGSAALTVTPVPVAIVTVSLAATSLTVSPYFSPRA